MTRSRDLANLADGVEFLAADHSKLDGIETAATADQTNAEIRAAVEAATDSNVFTDADHSKLNAIEASSDVTDTANVTAAGALMDSELTNLAAVKAINQTLVTSTSPTFAGLNFDAASGADAQVHMATDSNSRGFYVDESDANSMKFYTGYGKGVAGKEITFDNFGNLLVGGNITNGGTVITDGGITDTGDFTIDVAGDIFLDAGGYEIKLLGNGTQFGMLYPSNNNLVVQSTVSDGDMQFQVNDGGTNRIALTLDGSEAGAATFNSTVTATSFVGSGANLTGVGGSTAFGAVGTYILGRPQTTTTYATNATSSGLYAFPDSYTTSYNAHLAGTSTWTDTGNLQTSMSGTWRCMSGAIYANSDGTGGLWVRIS